MNEHVRQQLTLECIGQDEDGWLVRIPGPDPDDLGRVYVYKIGQEYHVYLNRDVVSPVRQQLRGLAPRSLFDNPERVKAILAEDGACQDVDKWRSYVFPDAPDVDAYLHVVCRQDEAGMSVFAILDGDKVVSACKSVRENETAGECYVYTEPDYRGQGYAGQVTACWACDMMQKGKVAFYSHLLSNKASASVAEKLGLVECFVGMVYN